MKLSEYLNKQCPLYIKNPSKREIRHDFFKSIDTELHAYLLGLIMSDGSINDKRATLSHNMSIKDKELIKFYKVICPNVYTKTFIPKSAIGPRGAIIQGKESIRVAIASTILISDLHNLGIKQNKTYKEQHIPTMKKELIRHFIRGYFDGDGSFSGSVVKDKGRKNPRVRMQFQIDSNTKSILIEIQNVLKEHNINVNIYNCKRDNMYRLATHSCKECKKLFKFLYSNVNCFLSRKFIKFNYYVNTEVTQIITEHRNAQEVNVNESNNPPTSVEHPIIDGENVC